MRCTTANARTRSSLTPYTSERAPRRRASAPGAGAPGAPGAGAPAPPAPAPPAPRPRAGGPRRRRAPRASATEPYPRYRFVIGTRRSRPKARVVILMPGGP